MMGTVSFPGLGLEFQLNRVAFHVGSWPVYWYGIIIAAGFLLAVFYCSRKAGQFGIRQDDIIDMLFFAVPLAIIGARLYYIIFYLDLFRREDGSLDFGLLIGQLVGRWGNFVNIEAYGGPTDLPWRMGIYEYVGGALQYAEVHPTFLYESLWNLLGLILLAVIAQKWRKFDGQMFLSYFAWYGVGRGCIEGLRTDSLYFFNTTVRVSQVFGFATAAVAIVLLAVNLLRRPHDPEALWVNQVRKNARRVALVYPEGPDARKWLERQKKRLEREGAYVETYALPAGAAEETGELLAALEAREDLDQILKK